MGTITETKLAAIWAELFDRADISDDADFLELAGDSLSAMACISRVRREFSVELSVEDFFMYPATIKSLGKLIDELRQQAGVGMEDETPTV